AKTKQIIVSPDGELNFVSIATLLSASGRFLAEEYLFSYVSCARDLLVENQADSASAELQVWANPDFGADISEISSTASLMCNGELDGLSFRPLPGAEKEGRTLCNRAQRLGFSNAVLHTGCQATEADLLRLHSPKALHLATHGFVLPQVEVPCLSSEEEANT